MASAGQEKLLSCLRSRRAGRCVCARARLRGAPGPHLLRPAGEEEIISPRGRTQEDDEEEEKTERAQSAIGCAGHLARRSLLQQFQFEQTHGVFWVGRFRLAAV